MGNAEAQYWPGAHLFDKYHDIPHQLQNETEDGEWLYPKKLNWIV